MITQVDSIDKEATPRRKFKWVWPDAPTTFALITWMLVLSVADDQFIRKKGKELSGWAFVGYVIVVYTVAIVVWIVGYTFLYAFWICLRLCFRHRRKSGKDDENIVEEQSPPMTEHTPLDVPEAVKTV
jgi:hypothetical protein